MPAPMPDSSSPDSNKRPFRLGVGGPVGSGKTMCVLRLSQWLKDEISLAVITNDIYTREDAEFLLREGVLDTDSSISEEKMAKFSDAELANTLGNLYQVTTNGTSLHTHTHLPS